MHDFQSAASKLLYKRFIVEPIFYARLRRCYVSIELGRFGPALLYCDRNPRLRCFLKRRAFEIFHDEERTPLVFSDIVERADVLMAGFHGDSGVRTLRELRRSYLTVTRSFFSRNCDSKIQPQHELQASCTRIVGIVEIPEGRGGLSEGASDRPVVMLPPVAAPVGTMMFGVIEDVQRLHAELFEIHPFLDLGALH